MSRACTMLVATALLFLSGLSGAGAVGSAVGPRISQGATPHYASIGSGLPNRRGCTEMSDVSWRGDIAKTDMSNYAIGIGNPT